MIDSSSALPVSVQAATPVVPARPAGAVRVLHTSDWHLGVAVRNLPRSADHDELIAELVTIAEAAEPDLIVHTGDVFDGHRPAMGEFGRAIKAFRALGEIAPVAVLAGNHDSSVALEVLGVAVGDEHLGRVETGSYDPHTVCQDRIRIHARPTTATKGSVATYPTRAGGRLRLVALPFVHANRVLVDFDDLVEANATYNDSLRKIIGALSKSCFHGFETTADVAVFASHLHVKDARTSSEKTIHIAEDYATDPAHLEGRFGYLAFGHIHVPQPIAGGRGQYAGSILQVDFGERMEDKRVVVVDLEAGRPTITTSVPLTAGRRLHIVRCPLSQLAEHAATVGRGIVEVTVTADPTDADAAAPIKATPTLDTIGTELGATEHADDEAQAAAEAEAATSAPVRAPAAGSGKRGKKAAIDVDATLSLFGLDARAPDDGSTATGGAESYAIGDVIVANGKVCDTLSQAVNELLPNSTVVGVIDGRRRNVRVADELDAPAVVETINDSYRSWLTGPAGDQIFNRHGSDNAVVDRVVSMFDEAFAAVTSGALIDFNELASLTAAIGELG